MPYTPWAASSREARSSRSPCANSTPWRARFRAVSLPELRVSARKFHPLASIWRMTAPPCCPVAPVMSTVLSALRMILSPVSRDSVHIFCGEQEPKRLLLALGTVYLARGRCTSGAFPITSPNLCHQEELLSLGNGVGRTPTACACRATYSRREHLLTQTQKRRTI